ncbi:histidine kinase [Aeromonas hydrophila]|nr:histidine kinase [Aeromonas hydrophila]
MLELLAISGYANASGNELLQVFSREREVRLGEPRLMLSVDDRRWLNHHQRLILGVPQPDSPPMDITLRSGSYEGVTADITGLLSRLLDIEILVRTYPSRAEAIYALQRGDIDMLSSSNIYEEDQHLLLTEEYVPDEPALYKSIGVKEQSIRSVAVPEYYLPAVDVLRYLPGLDVRVYPSRYSAMSAVSYGEVDAVMIDMISGNFLVNKYYQDKVHLLKPLYINTKGNAFALRAGSWELKRILDLALSDVYQDTRDRVAKRWSGGGLSISAKRLGLTNDEWDWLAKKRRIRVVVNSDMPPLGFLGVNGAFYGVTADLLQVLRAKLGIEIEVVPVGSIKEMAHYLDNGYVDSAIFSPSKERNYHYAFSRAFTLDPLSYIVNIKKREADPEYLMKFGTVAAVKDFISTKMIEDAYENLKIRKFDKVDDALRCVDSGSCDVVVLPLRMAKYQINNKYPESLVITGELFNSIPIGVSFAVLKEQSRLLDILNKVISVIPPDELDGLYNRWRVSSKQSTLTWQELVRKFGIFISLATLFIVVISLWGFSLRRQVSQRRFAESALSVQLKFIEDLIDGTPHPIYARDLSGNLILCNSSYAEFFRISKAELLKRNLQQDRERWPFLSLLLADFANAQERRQVQEGDHRLILEHEVVDVYHWVQPYYDLKGEVQGGVGGWIDVSERQRLLEELAVASQEAHEASRAKSTFLATMSHEIRTPMNAIIGLLELTLRRGHLYEEDQTSLAIAHDSATDLLSLIGDILDISKIESGRLDMAPQPHNASTLTESVVNIFSALARQKNLELELVSDGNHDQWVMIDGLRYKQIVSNLVSNAIKYTEQGFVRIELLLRVNGAVCVLQLVVEDTGIGIDPAEQLRLFQPFSQASQPEHIQKSGTGLGLMIARSLCEMMSGSLSLTSEPGRGTRIYVELMLPIAEVPESHLVMDSDFARENSRKLRVMVVDDHPTNRLLISQQLAYLGHEAVTAESGEKAMVIFAEQSFDVVITDFNMPGMSGFELARHCRTREQFNGGHHCVILGLTADARQEQVKEAYSAGMNDCLFKPVGLEELDRRLRLHMYEPLDKQLDIIAVQRDIRKSLGLLTGHQVELFLPLLHEFLTASDHDLLTLQQAVDLRDIVKFLESVHRLKGGARIIGVLQLVNVCNRIEEDDLTTEKMSLALDELQKIYKLVRQAIINMQEE